ncbi:methionine--tRNA ligase [Aquimonas sp.]|jgi:methionyl-tRNA synthetase|uniref:methionine--tRNA ligase n=1 Tax=Aquimonas sp. TaxID=1872588 RepID=UPI0037BF363D
MSHQAPLLVTCALPYANGHLHLGHLVGYIQADIWVRAQRMNHTDASKNQPAWFVCADDAHGTPIMLAAEKAGVAPEEFIRGIQASHERDFAEFGVAFDHYHSTHSDENRALAELIYGRLERDYIKPKSILQLFDPERQMFLPDRYIKGECPKCGAADQYGDNCEVCGAAYAPTDLKNPRSVVSGAVPELRESEHYFFDLPKFQGFLSEWLDERREKAAIAPSVHAKLSEWLVAGLRDWDISRDAPYFGFAIPGKEGKFFYVWLDAPIGYLASFKALCDKNSHSMNFETLTAAGSSLEMHHFIGKDIINFHGLFWPAMLKGAGMKVPSALHVNGYLTVNGAKMSKSRGTFIQARTYLDAGLNPEYLRYYFAAKSSGGVDDLDLNLEDFAQRVNADIVGKFVNIASRCAGFIEKRFGGQLCALAGESKAYWTEAKNRIGDELIGKYESGAFGSVIRVLMAEADRINERIAEKAPWALAKQEGKEAELHDICSLGLRIFGLIAADLYPIVPGLSGATRSLFVNQTINLPEQSEDLRADRFKRLMRSPTESLALLPFTPLATRIDPKHIETMIDNSKESLAPAAEATKANAQPAAATQPPASTPPPAKSESPIPNPIAIEDFAKLDLRIGKVLECAFIDGSDKLLRFKLDAGDLGERQIFSGIRAAYADPDKLVGRSVVFIANLAPRKMRFGISEGMILSAGSGGEDLFLLDVDAGALPGAQVK